MSKKVSPIPQGYHSVTPYLIVRNAAEAIRFYERAFGAKEHLRLASPDGKVGHAELKIGDSFVMLADEHPDYGAHSPETIGGSSVSLLLYVQDVDALFAQALHAGATEVRPVKDQFYGDRAGTVQDPYGHKWSIATHIEDVPQAEVERRFRSMMGQGE
jgi:PhnB protein